MRLTPSQVLFVIMALSLVAVMIIIVCSYCLQFQTLRFYSGSLLLLSLCMLSQGVVFLLDLDQLTAAAAACSIVLVFLKTTIYMCMCSPCFTLFVMSHCCVIVAAACHPHVTLCAYPLPSFPLLRVCLRATSSSASRAQPPAPAASALCGRTASLLAAFP
jgi:hypothetical protein